MADITLRAVGTKVNGTTSVVISQPTGTLTDDILVAFVIDHKTSGVTTAPTGWTRQGGIAGTDGRFQVFTAVKGRNGLTGTSWTWSSLTTRTMGQIIGYYNGNPSAPIDCLPTARLNASGASGTTQITTVANGAMVIAAFASLANGCTWSAEAVATSPALTEQADSAYSTYCSLAIAHGLKATAGATGASSATQSAGCANEGILLSLTTLQVPVIVIPSPFVATLAIQPPIITGGSSIVPDAVVLSFGIQIPDITGGATISPDVVTLALEIQKEMVSGAANVFAEPIVSAAYKKK